MTDFGLTKIIAGLDLRKDISLIETELMKQPQVACPVIHRFGPGVYIRELAVPAGTLAIGHHQNFEHMNVFLKGRVTVLNDDGTTTELSAPMIFTGKPGRKIGFVHEDMVWLNIYPTTEKDVEKLESHFLTKSTDWLETNEKIKLLCNDLDKKDFLEVLSEFGFTPEQVRAQSENQDDLTDLPFGSYKIKVGRSNIEGQGLIAMADIEDGEFISPARIGGKRTIAGRYTNHSANPNAKFLRSGQGADLIAIKNISGCHGGLDGEEITVDYRDALKLNFELGGNKCQD